jgi:transcriptional regulator with XRE-family HTH domain
MKELEIGRKIKKIREIFGLTQETLSNLTGIARDKISRVEKYEMTVTAGELFSLAKGLGFKMDDFASPIDDFIKKIEEKKAMDGILKKVVETKKTYQEN